MNYNFNAFQPITVTSNSITFDAGPNFPDGYRVVIGGTGISYDAVQGTLTGNISAVYLVDYSGSFARTVQTISIPVSGQSSLAGQVTAFLTTALDITADTFTAWCLKAAGFAAFGDTIVTSDAQADLELLDSAGTRVGYLRLNGSGFEAALLNEGPASAAAINSIEHLDAAGALVPGHIANVAAGATLAQFYYGTQTLSLPGVGGAEGLYDVLIASGVTIRNEVDYPWVTITSGSNADTFYYAYGITVDVADAQAAVHVDLGLGRSTGGSGNDSWVPGLSAGAIGSAFDDTIIGGSSINYMVGGGGNDAITGNGLTDLIEGGAGNDTLTGGDGDDWFAGGSGDDVIHGGANAGSNFTNASDSTDDLLAFSHIVIPVVQGAPNLPIWKFLQTRDFNTGASNSGITVTYIGADSGTVTGSAIGNDTFDGIELVLGSNGNDVFTASSQGNVFTGMGGDDSFNGAGGLDTVSYEKETLAASIAAQVSNGTLTAGAIVNLSSGTRIIAGVTLLGGTARDVLGGTDTFSSIEIVEGSRLNDTIIGGSGNETLSGSAGDDCLAGGSGNDVLWGSVRGASTGGTIYDIADYRLDGGNSAIAVVVAADGTATVTDTFGDIDTLHAIGTIGGTDLSDTFTGSARSDRFAANGGNDTITGGGAGSGLGGDQLTYLTDDAATDGIAYDGLLSSGQIESTGGADDWGTDTLIGFSKIWLEATQNADNLKGGQGDDVFLASLGTDVIDGRGGNNVLFYTDAKSSASGVGVHYTASATTANKGTVIDTGGATDSYQNIQVLGGSMANDTFIGKTFNDTFAGFKGNDTFIGGGGFDSVSYAFDAAHADALGFDLRVLDGEVFSAVVHGLGVNLVTGRVTGLWEDLGTAEQEDTDTLIGITKVIGTKYNDNFVGNDQANAFDGGAGDDDMSGGKGNDTYYVDNSGDRIIESTLGSGGVDTVITCLTTSLQEGIENFVLSGSGAVNGTGNTANNSIKGNAAANRLNGLGGNDTLTGGAGADTFTFNSPFFPNGYRLGNDTITDFAAHAKGGADLIDLTIAGIGSMATLNVLVRDVGASAVLEVNKRELGPFKLTLWNVHEADLTAADFKLLSSTVSRNLAGDSLANDLFGARANDTLNGAAGNDRLFGETGNDKLIGGLGGDTMYGGQGNDTYFVDSYNDVIDESLIGSTGIDEVRASISYILNDPKHILGVVENLTLEGTAVRATGNSGNNTIKGNSLANILNGVAGNDTIFGGGGADTLDGGTGADSMVGGAYKDVYIVDNAADVVDESTSTDASEDQVITKMSFSLDDKVHVKGTVEDLFLDGSAAINGTGNAAENVIIGNVANNRLSGLAGDDLIDGGYGKDQLIGGTGGDAFLFSTVLDAGNVDTIIDFDIKNDGIVLVASIFKGVVPGADQILLSAALFKANSSGTATDSDDRIIYNTLTGALFYDSNGNGAGGAIQFAVLANKAALSSIDFVVI